MTRTTYEEELPGGLRYTEVEGDLGGALMELMHPFLQRVWTRNRMPATLCRLWDGRGEGKEPLSYLTLFRYRQRFGAASLPVCGYGGVATPPRHRRRGHVTTLMEKSMARAGTWATAFFLNGIRRFYTRWDFATCLLKAHTTLSVRWGETARPLAGATCRELTPADAPEVCRLFNREHALRPGTTVREPSTFVGPLSPEDWCAGEAAMVLQRHDRLVGYMIFSSRNHGNHAPFVVTEIVGEDAAAAEGLVAEALRLALERRVDTLEFHDVPDSTVGTVLRLLGCEATLVYPPDGGWMGRVVERRRFVEELSGELSRRAGRDDSKAVEALASGTLYPDDTVLMPLMTGYWSWQDAARAGRLAPDEFKAIARQWFPGGGTPLLPLPFVYDPDHY